LAQAKASETIFRFTVATSRGMATNYEIKEVRNYSDVSSDDSVESSPKQQERRFDECWKRACHAKYVLGVCRDKRCNYVHDLDSGDITKFAASRQGLRHHVFDTASTSGSNSASSSFGGSSFTGDIQGDNRSRTIRMQYQEHQRKLRARFQRMNATELAAALPMTLSGEPSSIGSVLHESKECRPCRNMLVSNKCNAGMQCMYCHLEHQIPSQVLEAQCATEGEPSSEREKGRKGRRPSKAMRCEYRKVLAQYEVEIKKDPLHWKAESVIIPTYLKDPVRIMKFMRRLENVAFEARQSRLENVAAEAHRGSMENMVAEARRLSTTVTHVPSASNNTQAGGRARRLISL